jgi:hypothetical protein
MRTPFVGSFDNLKTIVGQRSFGGKGHGVDLDLPALVN